MPYTPTNNPYVPGDPYSYDLKWMVQEVKAAKAVGEQAAGSAAAAAASAEAAGDSAYNAGTYASNALVFSQNAEASADAAASSAQQAASSATAAAGSAQQAAASAADNTQAQNAEAWAVGTKNGVAVPSTAEQYHNNAKYWAEQAVSGSIVDAFNISRDSMYVNNSGWNYRRITAAGEGVLMVSLSVIKDSADTTAKELAANIDFYPSGGSGIEYAVEWVTTGANSDDRSSVSATVFIKVSANDVVRLGAYKTVDSMHAITNIVAIGTEITIDSAFTAATLNNVLLSPIEER